MELEQRSRRWQVRKGFYGNDPAWRAVAPAFGTPPEHRYFGGFHLETFQEAIHYADREARKCRETNPDAPHRFCILPGTLEGHPDFMHESYPELDHSRWRATADDRHRWTRRADMHGQYCNDGLPVAPEGTYDCCGCA